MHQVTLQLYCRHLANFLSLTVTELPLSANILPPSPSFLLTGINFIFYYVSLHAS